MTAAPAAGPRPPAALLARLVDDAGIFPPEELPMAAALARHRADSAAAHPVLTHRFLCPAGRLPELSEALSGERAGSQDGSPGSALDGSPDGREPVLLGLITPLEPDAARAALKNLDGAGPGLRLVAAEGPLPQAADPADAARRARAALDVLERGARRDLPCHVEVPLTGRWREVLPELAAAGLGAKVRCGGVRPELFPSTGSLGAFVHACAGLRLPFKATAGLHRAVRYRDGRTGFTHHGFLNLLLAVCRAVDGGSAADVAAVLESGDAAALAAEARAVPDGLARTARTLFTAYGSCSTAEPLEDLRALGLTDDDPAGGTAEPVTEPPARKENDA
ncbi:hypothetical protein GCM10010406_27970 [Streptomyces thermolineatus]|uniref:Uncharacterized protein n=1 Tax=Streptomyces thermolineatus TaxID=44033 RepID=A0ABP5Z2W9_9ACTN